MNPISLSLSLSRMEGKKQPHFILVPLMAQGHMIPMLDMAQILAHRGALVSYITTPVNATRVKHVIDRVNASGLVIRLVELPFPCAEAGLPVGGENLDLIDPSIYYVTFFEGTRLLQKPLKLYIEEQQPAAPTCMIADMCLPWTAHIARELRIPRFVFHGPSCLFVLCIHNLERDGILDRVDDVFEPFLVPGLPDNHRLSIPKAHAAGFFSLPGMEKLRDEAAVAEATADGVLLNSFNELEREFIECYQTMTAKRVWAIGPLSLSNNDATTQGSRGNTASIDQTQMLSWLDSMQPGSVVYASFGSLTNTPFPQLVEIGLGLEASGRPFIWVVKEAVKSPDVENWLSGVFEERTSGRGLIVKGWAPQLMILSHPAVGCFLTHCGWNSVLEAVSAGVPMVTWPHFADQFINERLAVDVLGVSVSLGVKLPFYLREGSDVAVRSNGVETAVARLMDGGEERETARELGEKARDAMREGGSSDENMNLLINYVLENEGRG